jgi:hypothetical protein
LKKEDLNKNFNKFMKEREKNLLEWKFNQIVGKLYKNIELKKSLDAKNKYFN